ncbi:MAG: right-handed parallel beta-helix repeat-containing protein, partial [Nitrospirales bacterium]
HTVFRIGESLAMQQSASRPQGMIRPGSHQNPSRVAWGGLVHGLPLLGLMILLLGFGGFLQTVRAGVSESEILESKREGGRTLVVALDGSGDYRSIQEAIDEAEAGDTIRIKAGDYPEDVTIHSKQHIRIVGEDVERVRILGLERVGSFHVGKWPYGATDIEIQGVTIAEHGGLALGIFNGSGIVLRDARVAGSLFGQQVKELRIENCQVGGSETTGIQFADSQAVLVGNVIHDNDHGVAVAGQSDVRLENNVILRNLFEGVVVKDRARAVLRNNTIVKNGGGVAFRGASRSEVSGNIIGFNKVGFIVEPGSTARITYNALYNGDHEFRTEGAPNGASPVIETEANLTVDPGFVDFARDDFRLRADSPLTRIGDFAYLGAFAPITSQP